MERDVDEEEAMAGDNCKQGLPAYEIVSLKLTTYLTQFKSVTSSLLNVLSSVSFSLPVLSFLLSF